jgi:predicted nuclease with TOPRIM domain
VFEEMNVKIICLILLLTGFSWPIYADEKSLQVQIDDIKEQIRQEEILKEQLRADLDVKDSEVAKLRKKLEELEEKPGG